MSSQQPVTVERAYAYLVLRTSRLLRFHFHAMTAALDIQLSPEQWLLLNRLTQQDGVPQRELIDATFRDRPNVSRMLGSLERNGLIRRRTDRQDGRRYLVFLTAAGRQLHERLVPEVHRQRKIVYRGLNDQDFADLSRILNVIDRNILEGA